MSYKMPIVCKGITLPISSDCDGMTIEDYKNYCGIDLIKELGISLDEDNKYINYNCPNTSIKLVDLEGILTPSGQGKGNVYPVTSVYFYKWISESQPGSLELHVGNDDFYLHFLLLIDKNEEFKIENVKIMITGTSY